MKYILKIDGLPSEAAYNGLAFGRQLEHRRAIEAFKATAKHVHFDCKHRTTAAGFRAFRKLYRPTQWFAVNHDAPMYHDDSCEVWYTDAN